MLDSIQFLKHQDLKKVEKGRSVKVILHFFAIKPIKNTSVGFDTQSIFWEKYEFF